MTIKRKENSFCFLLIVLLVLAFRIFISDTVHEDITILMTLIKIHSRNLLFYLIPWMILMTVYGIAFGLVTTNPLLTSYVTVLYLPSTFEPTVSCFGVVVKVDCVGVV